MTPRILAGTLALAALAGPAAAQEPALALDCQLTVICLDTRPCRDWNQDLAVSGSGEDWQVDWVGDRVQDYALISDLAAPDGSLAPTRLRTIFYQNPATQAVQFMTFEEAGAITVTISQPQIMPRAITAFGTCRPAEAGE